LGVLARRLLCRSDRERVSMVVQDPKESATVESVIPLEFNLVGVLHFLML
jgi:hypothetical protein